MTGAKNEITKVGRGSSPQVDSLRFIMNLISSVTESKGNVESSLEIINE